MSDPAKTQSKPKPFVPPPYKPTMVFRPTIVIRPNVEQLFFFAFLLILAIGVPLLYAAHVLDITTVNQLGRFLCVAIVAIGIDLVWGYTGMLSLCQAMFFCIGGYAMGMHLALHGPLDGDAHDVPRALFVVSSVVNGFHLPWFWKPFQTLPVACFLGLLLPGILAFIFGFLTFRSRVRGVYFSIITQATTYAAWLVLCQNNMLLCGTNGLTNFVTIAGFDLQAPGTKVGLYILTVIVLGIVYAASLFLINSRLGRLMVAIRDNEPRLRFTGYQPVAIKLFVFSLGAVLAGLAGMLYTPQNGIITPFKMSVPESIELVVIVAVGGRSTLSGAVVGALIVSFLKSLLTNGTLAQVLGFSFLPASVLEMVKHVFGAEGWPFLLGLVFIIVPVSFPEGIVGVARKIAGRRPGVLGRPKPAGAAAAGQGVIS